MSVYFKSLGQKGRLGNQLFQLAATITLAIDNQDNFIFPNWEYKDFFNLKGCFSDNINYQNQYNEPFFHYQKIKYQPELNLEGYFQSEKYFKHQQDLIKYLLSPMIPINSISNSVSLHVRHGDYLTLGKCFEVVDLNYYHEALKQINAKRIYVFSDDIPWCRANFQGDKYIFMENNSAAVDFAIMSTTTHNIIANSSFSWWAAWLNKNSNKIVVAPKKWFGPDLEKTHNTKDLIPEGWITI